MTFKAAAEWHWCQIALPETGSAWAICEAPECDTWIPEGTVPHHLDAAGLGGEREHDPDRLQHLCRRCHDAVHAHTLEVD